MFDIINHYIINYNLFNYYNPNQSPWYVAKCNFKRGYVNIAYFDLIRLSKVKETELYLSIVLYPDCNSIRYTFEWLGFKKDYVNILYRKPMEGDIFEVNDNHKEVLEDIMQFVNIPVKYAFGKKYDLR